jgi:antitoxin (DNA-binding transcriptional repressor) of toxin-antitoxin stability system
MSIETRTIRVAEAELADRLNEVLDRVAKGERIIVERAGEEFAVIEPSSPPKLWTWNELVHFLKYEASFDEEFARIVREIRDAQPPMRAVEWPD